MKRTADIEALVNEVLQTILNWTSNITDLVFMAIEQDEDGWLVEYNYLENTLTKQVVNPQIAQYVSKITGLEKSGRQCKAQSRLIKSGKYSELI